ncbi:MAG TPA: hypothetical protein V6D06_09130 [Trichocoleus sp.]
MRTTLLLLLVIAPAIAGITVFGRAALTDWDSLQQAYQRFELTIQTSDDLTQIFIAESLQSIHRINLFADGVWTLLSAILGAIGLHGLERRL